MRQTVYLMDGPVWFRFGGFAALFGMHKHLRTNYWLDANWSEMASLESQSKYNHSSKIEIVQMTASHYENIPI